MPLVSIILPYYKKIKFFKQTYRSIKKQNYRNYELIIVYDDTNLYEYKKILKIIGNNKKVKIILNKNNLGAGLSRNIGIKYAKGYYIAFIDADDTWNKNKLKKQIKFIKKNNFQFICCNYQKKINNSFIEVKPDKKISYDSLIKNCQIGLSTVIIKKSIIVNRLFPNYKTQEDFSAWLKLMRLRKISCFTLNEKLVTWHYDKDSLSSNTIQKIKDAFRVFTCEENKTILMSSLYVLRLSINSIRRKLKLPYV